MRNIIQLFFLTIALLFIACTNDSQDDLILEEQVIDDTVTYTDDVQPIMATSCNLCHTSPPINGAPFSLLTFQEVSSQADRILARMDEGTMPPSGRLPQITIDVIAAWIENGSPE